MLSIYIYKYIYQSTASDKASPHQPIMVSITQVEGPSAATSYFNMLSRPAHFSEWCML